ncbi:MAG TPA: DJ-1 family glyoxalase III [Opitutaceae bacterium]|nr:DJ-1 family glyoxalase III [Opitutaceae bacterium]
MPKVLVVLPEGFEEIEAVTPIDLLRRAGAVVTVAALTENIHVTGRSELILHADTTLSAVGGQPFDMVMLPGGPGVINLRNDPRVAQLVRLQASAGRWVAAICAAPSVLFAAGLLEGQRYTAHFSVAKELKEIRADERVVVDGNIITSRGAGTALDFGSVLVEKLFSAEKAAEVRAAICA